MNAILKSPCECGIESPGFISHGVSWLVKPTGKRPSRRPRRRWEENIRIDVKEIDINSRSWVDSAQDRDY